MYESLPPDKQRLLQSVSHQSYKQTSGHTDAARALTTAWKRDHTEILTAKKENRSGISLDYVREHLHSSVSPGLQNLVYTQNESVHPDSKKGNGKAGSAQCSKAGFKTPVFVRDTLPVVQMHTAINYYNHFLPVAGYYGRIHYQPVPPGTPGAILRYDNQAMSGNSIINAAAHRRVPMNSGERATALQFPQPGIPLGLFCNHHVPYDRIQGNIIANYLLGQSVNTAIGNLNAVIGVLNTVGAGYAIIPPVIYVADANMMSQEFDDAIANIANDPRNLFYASYHSGDGGGVLVDFPTLHNPGSAMAIAAGAANIIQDPILNGYEGILTFNGI